VSLPRAQQASAAHVLPECRVGEHSWCKPGAVYADGVLLFPAKRCDCSCHRKADQ
jgi:hypothetical protein